MYNFNEEMMVKSLEANGYRRSMRENYWRSYSGKYVGTQERTLHESFEHLLRKLNLL
jgi:hypothetical protein